MKAFVKIIGVLTGIALIVFGILSCVNASTNARFSNFSTAEFVIIGIAMLFAGIFWLGLIWWLSNIESRFDRIEAHIASIEVTMNQEIKQIKEAEKKRLAAEKTISNKNDT